MSQIEDVAAQYVKPPDRAVTGATRLVADAFRLAVPPEEEYVESEVAIESLEFASFAVGGLAATAKTPTAGVRADTTVTLPLADSGTGTAESTQHIVLYGPGDVRGIDSEQIIRRHPAPGTPDAEETDLAHVEFDRPELPWAFSAASATAGMRPWVTLIVVPKDVVRWLPTTGQLALIQVPFAELPQLTGAHLWAHAQTAQSGSVSLPTRLSPEYAPVNLSRLVSPRVMDPDTEYFAAVVPTTSIGVGAGRGLTEGSLSPAWASGAGETITLPVYDSWEFRTGEAGDFASLALRLQGVAAPYEVGRRFIDASEPGRPLAPLPDGASGAKQVLRCALYSPSPPPPEHEEAETAKWPASQTTQLREQLDLPAAIEGAAASVGGIPDVPILGPRVYAKLHRGAAVITGSDWFAELNLDPMHRIVAGLGTRVVQTDQEQLMQAAWAQLGDVQKANRAIALAEIAEHLATRLHVRLSDLEPTRLLQVAAPLATRISLTAGATLKAEVAASAMPVTVLSGAFRRSVRPDGPVLRRADVASRARIGTLAGTGTATRDFTRVYADPDGVAGLSATAIAGLDATRVAPVLDVSISSVTDVLTRAGGALSGGVFAHLADTTTWRTVGQGLDLAGIAVERWGEIVLREPSVTAAGVIRDQRIAPLVAELAVTKASTGQLSKTLTQRAQTLNNSLIVRRADVVAPVLPTPSPRGAVVTRGLSVTGGLAITRGAVIGVEAPVLRGAAGLRVLDTGDLTRVTVNSPAATKKEALAQLAGLAAVPLTPAIDAWQQLPPERLRGLMSALIDPAGISAIAPVERRATVRVDALAAALEPRAAIRSHLRGRLRLSAALEAAVFVPQRIRRIMAAPVFRRPMYEALHAYDPDWLVPGLGLLPATDFVTVLATNSTFIEAFLVGLSDEMGRELLWRNYPTDQSGTYFRRFWDRDQDELAQQIHAFSPTDLGTHVKVGGDGAGGATPRAVIVVKSELVRRYPDVIIQAVRNTGTPEHPKFDDPGAVARQLFAAHLPPDVTLVGLDLGLDEIDGPDWWITIAEHPTATRFDRPADAAGPFYAPAGAADAASFAAETLHDPVRVAFHATDLVVRED